MIKWIKHKIINWASKDQSYQLASSITAKEADYDDFRIGRGRGIDFSIIKANGGWIVEVSTYDRKIDETQRSLHLINNDQELGDSIAKVITYELLTR